MNAMQKPPEEHPRILSPDALRGIAAGLENANSAAELISGLFYQALHQVKVRQADAKTLDHAATYCDDPALLVRFYAELGNSLAEPLIRLFQDILETSYGEPVIVSFELRNQVEQIAIQHFKKKEGL